MTGGISSWLPWALVAITTTIAFVGWAESRSWQFNKLTAISLSPLLGLWAWSIMWTHYAYGGLRLVNENLRKNRAHTQVTMYIVLVLILLHPGLLAYSQWDLKGTLPPESLYSYVAPSLKIYVLLGSISLLMFLAYDILVRLKQHPLIARNWKWVSLSQAVAMTLIFAHSLKLGQNLQGGWMQFYWIVLGALLIPCFGLILRKDWMEPSK